MIYYNVEGEQDCLVSDEVLKLPHIVHFLTTVSHEAPGFDLSFDRALILGYLAVRDYDAGRLQENRAVAQQVHDADDYDTLVAAALTFLAHFPEAFDVDETFARWRANRAAFADVIATLGEEDA